MNNAETNSRRRPLQVLFFPPPSALIPLPSSLRPYPLSLIPLLLSALFLSSCVATPPARMVVDPTDLTDPMTPQLRKRLAESTKLYLRPAEDYYLGPGDIITIRLIGRPDILGTKDNQEGVQFTLSDSPSISLPLIGAIVVRNKTVAELQDALAQAYAAYVKDPRPLVFVDAYEHNQVTVLGTVATPGKYRYEYGDTILDAVFKAGGPSTGGRGGGFAPGPYLHIYRERLSQKDRAILPLEEIARRLTTGGRIEPREEIVMPVQELITQGTLQYNLPVQPGDILYIAPAGTVYVQGRVDTPGVCFLGPSVNTVTQAVAERGGLRYSANDICEVVRKYPDGQYVTYRLNIRQMRDRQARDFRIQDGDEIYIYGSPPRAFGEWLGQLIQGSVRAGASATYNPVQ